ncbi:hypothetical protein SBA3_290033 [Candidatus Sulfopaludibacter sp. SbA3]|nr:hypothetical protein SBA3_290033 [Candidatus Sulfopaludibacter sp. SbA3]
MASDRCSGVHTRSATWRSLLFGSARNGRSVTVGGALLVPGFDSKATEMPTSPKTMRWMKVSNPA